MRFLIPLSAFLTVAAFQSALSASLESAEKEEQAVPYDGLAELKKIDQMEFEAAQKSEAAQMNVTEEQNEDGRYLEAAQDESKEEHVGAEDDNSAEGGGNSGITAIAAAAAEPAAAAAAAAAHEESESGSSEETEGRQRREHHEAVTETVSKMEELSQDSTKEQGLRMQCSCPENMLRNL